MTGGKYLASERGAFDVIEQPKQEAQSKPATAPLWESARMDSYTTHWMLMKWRMYGDMA